MWVQTNVFIYLREKWDKCVVGYEYIERILSRKKSGLFVWHILNILNMVLQCLDQLLTFECLEIRIHWQIIDIPIFCSMAWHILNILNSVLNLLDNYEFYKSWLIYMI